MIVLIGGSVVGVVLLGTLPYWLPSSVLKLRVLIFTRINGEEGMAIPGPRVDASRFKQVYSHPAANGRSRGAALSDLFWYWLSPGPEIHQEHIEPGEKYEEVARTTRRILSVPRKAAQEMAARCLARVVNELDVRTIRFVRLRDLMMPFWADFYCELVFGKPGSAEAQRLVVGNANDVVTALKCCGLRHMEKRNRLTKFLIEKIKAGEIPHRLPEHLTTEERALYLQGAFFNTAVVQMSEGMVHLLMVVAQHPEVQERLASNPDDDRYLDQVIDEALRLYPLFGISHRITSAEIAVDEQTVIPRGTVLCFNHPEFQRVGFDRPESFDPGRWDGISHAEANYIPFGVSANRPCPAQGLAPITMRAAAREMLSHFALYSSASHTRSVPNRGPCILERRKARIHPRKRAALLALMRVRDRWEDCWRSVVQLVLGTYMVWDARRLRLCERYFQAHGTSGEGPTQDVPRSACPMSSAHRPAPR